MFSIVGLVGLVIWLIIVTMSVAYDKYVAAFWTVVVPIVALTFFFKDEMLAMLGWITWQQALLSVVGYIVAGFAIALVKWGILSRKTSKRWAKELAEFDRKYPEMTGAERIQKFRSGYSSGRVRGMELVYDEVANKATIKRDGNFVGLVTSWVFWWPFIALASIVDDFIFNLISNITRLCGGVFQSVTDMITVRELK